jgi:hypothetical protein
LKKLTLIQTRGGKCVYGLIENVSIVDGSLTRMT